MTLVLKTLRSNETLDLRSLGVWLLALALWLNLTTDYELADLKFHEHFVSISFSHSVHSRRSARRTGDKDIRSYVHRHPW